MAWVFDGFFRKASTLGIHSTSLPNLLEVQLKEVFRVERISLDFLVAKGLKKGLILVTLSASLRSLHQSWIFFFSIYLVALGQGGHKPCLQAFGADQFEDGDPVEKKYKSSFFNYWYWGICFGTLLGVTVLLYIQDNVGWGLGFGIPAVTMLIALFAFLCGTRFYRHKLPDGSPLTRIVHVFVATFHKWNVSSPRQEGKKVAAAAESEGLKLGSRRQCLPTDQFKLSLLADHG